MSEKRETIEDALHESDEFGFRLRWRVKDYWAEVEAFEIVALGGDQLDQPYFRQDGWTDSMQMVESIEEAETYLDGFVKWDGCTELDMGCPHWCGPGGYQKHIALLEYIYKRAFELMGREPEESW